MEQVEALLDMADGSSRRDADGDDAERRANNESARLQAALDADPSFRAEDYFPTVLDACRDPAGDLVGLPSTFTPAPTRTPAACSWTR